MRGPKQYRSIEDFQREEIAPSKRCGWSLDDLYDEASFNPAKEDVNESEQVRELDFSY
ncbi:MAG: hypothetical protein AAF355_09400 [Myxococcota bacterium]